MTDSIALVDTNILVYAYDIPKCMELIESCYQGKRLLAVTNQVLAEFCFVATEKLKESFPAERVSESISRIITFQGFKKLRYKENTVQKALEISTGCKVHFWDALIAATMLENNITIIYTENEKDFSKIPGIKVINPLK